MTPDMYEQLRLRLLQCRAVVSLMRKWAGDEEGDVLLRDGHPANTLQWAADIAAWARRSARQAGDRLTPEDIPRAKRQAVISAMRHQAQHPGGP